jgi:hypothetical protein
MHLSSEDGQRPELEEPPYFTPGWFVRSPPRL